jgi:hypothetical protein
VNSLVEAIKYLLLQDGVEYIFTNRFNQDVLEEYFGKQRAIGGSRSDNPTVKQYLENTATIHVVKTSSIHVKRGNVKRQLPFGQDTKTPLPKRKRTPHTNA